MLQEGARVTEMLQEVNPNRDRSFDDYLSTMSKDGVWGDGTILLAASLLYKRQIIIYSDQGHQPTRLSDTYSDHGAIRLGYAGGNHYFILLPKQVPTDAGVEVAVESSECTDCSTYEKVNNISSPFENNVQFLDQDQLTPGIYV